MPNAAIPAAVTSPMLAILNSKLAMAHGATDAANAATTDTAGPLAHPRGVARASRSGPYTLAEYDPNSQVIIGRNVKYWRARPKFDKVVIRNVPSQAQLLDVQRGADGDRARSRRAGCRRAQRRRASTSSALRRLRRSCSSRTTTRASRQLARTRTSSRRSATRSTTRRSRSSPGTARCGRPAKFRRSSMARSKRTTG